MRSKSVMNIKLARHNMSEDETHAEGPGEASPR